ncbi:hypothetical protein MWU50_07475 [Flavobacteriaceae bacterium S0862]|nr:hypothetical protein [Flavobacteriaceae bacterium S0862]
MAGLTGGYIKGGLGCIVLTIVVASIVMFLEPGTIIDAIKEQFSMFADGLIYLICSLVALYLLARIFGFFQKDDK